MSEKSVLISQYIDNELNIDEKITFVTEIRKDKDYFEDTLGLLEMEREMSFVTPTVMPVIKTKSPMNLSLAASFVALAASLLVVVKVFFMAPDIQEKPLEHRFVVFMPDAENVELAGSFSAWKPIEMQKTSGGYWQVSLSLNEGEYLYNYIVNGEEQLPDPTVPAKQDDGFGGENSIINIGERI